MKNQEIEFKVWDIEEKQMLYPDGTYGPYMEPNTKLITELLAEAINGEWGGDELTENHVLLQYTGLKDKNDTKIYDCDLLKIQLPMGGFWGKVKTEKVGRVEYNSDYGGYLVVWEYSKNQHHVNLTCDIACESEVTGHIFE